MDYLYQLPERDKEDEAYLKYSDPAIAKFLKLDISNLKGEELSKTVLQAWWDYIDENDLSNTQTNLLLDSIHADADSDIPYTPKYPKHHADFVEKQELYSVELYIHVIAQSHGMLSDPLDVRYLWQILQERVNELISINKGEGQTVKIARLATAIDWFKGYEQRLANSLVRQSMMETPFSWKGSKADLAELGYALLEAGLIDAPNRANAVKKLGETFGVALGENPAVHLQTIQKRKAGALLTPLLDRLRDAFSQYLKRKDETDADRRKKQSRRENTA